MTVTSQVSDTPPSPVLEEKDFDWDTFRADLGTILYNHRVTLEIVHKYEGHWDDDGYHTLAVTQNGKILHEIGDSFPRRRSKPDWAKTYYCYH